MTPESYKDDPERLAELRSYHILDTPAEQSFDDIVKLASAICATPVALVSLVERDRQWFKARRGFEACDTPIDQSVCQHALGQTQLLIIPDLTTDPRTSRNTLVTEEPHIRFYAGAPLVTPKGHIIGTLCVIDQQPRPGGLTPDQAEMLQALARQVMMQLELRRMIWARDQTVFDQRDAIRVADARIERQTSAEEAGGVGTFEVDIDSGTMRVSAEFCRIFGLPVAEIYHVSVLEQIVLKEDADRRSNQNTRLDGTAPLDAEYRVSRMSDGGVRWIARRAKFERDAEGRPRLMRGTVRDVTDRLRHEQQQAALLTLGDQLRDVETPAQAIAYASSILGETLGASRAGYGLIDMRERKLRIIAPYSATGDQMLVGNHDLDVFPVSFEKLASGETLIVNNMPVEQTLGTDVGLYAATGIVAMIDIPLIDHGALVGVAFAHQSAPRSWTADEISFAQGVADRVHATLAKLDAEANQDLLNRELGHRMKNQLALVGAIVNQTLRSAPDQETARNSLNARIAVLANAHDQLLQGEEGRALVSDLIRKVTALHDDEQNVRFRVTGPAIMVASRPALSLSLILHELSTNAAKYGALSVDGGLVDVEWQVEKSADGDRFVLSWSEIGGPAVSEPKSRGSGSRLIKAGLSGTSSEVTVDYRESGLRFRIVAALAGFSSER